MYSKLHIFFSKSLFIKWIGIFIIYLLGGNLHAEEMTLRDNFKTAKVGDYIVTSQNKSFTLFLIDEITAQTIGIEEVTVPASKVNIKTISWKNWLKEDAPFNTSWVRYVINLQTGKMEEYFSYTKNGYFTIPESENFLTTLLNLKLEKIPLKERKKIGPKTPFQAVDNRPYWQPKLIFEGAQVPNVAFDAWKTYWPKDGSELSDKQIEVYLPQDFKEYPSYFPYWLQISGFVGKAKVHIIDSGREGIGKYHL